METLTRRVISVTKLKGGLILALCEDGTMWVAPVVLSGNVRWMQVSGILK